MEQQLVILRNQIESHPDGPVKDQMLISYHTLKAISDTLAAQSAGALSTAETSAGAGGGGGGGGYFGRSGPHAMGRVPSPPPTTGKVRPLAAKKARVAPGDPSSGATCASAGGGCGGEESMLSEADESSDYDSGKDDSDHDVKQVERHGGQEAVDLFKRLDMEDDMLAAADAVMAGDASDSEVERERKVATEKRRRFVAIRKAKKAGQKVLVSNREMVTLLPPEELVKAWTTDANGRRRSTREPEKPRLAMDWKHRSHLNKWPVTCPSCDNNNGVILDPDNPSVVTPWENVTYVGCDGGHGDIYFESNTDVYPKFGLCDSGATCVDCFALRFPDPLEIKNADGNVIGKINAVAVRDRMRARYSEILALCVGKEDSPERKQAAALVYEIIGDDAMVSFCHMCLSDMKSLNNKTFAAYRLDDPTFNLPADAPNELRALKVIIMNTEYGRNPWRVSGDIVDWGCVHVKDDDDGGYVEDVGGNSEEDSDASDFSGQQASSDSDWRDDVCSDGDEGSSGSDCEIITKEEQKAERERRRELDLVRAAMASASHDVQMEEPPAKEVIPLTVAEKKKNALAAAEAKKPSKIIIDEFEQRAKALLDKEKEAIRVRKEKRAKQEQANKEAKKRAEDKAALEREKEAETASAAHIRMLNAMAMISKKRDGL